MPRLPLPDVFVSKLKELLFSWTWPGCISIRLVMSRPLSGRFATCLPSTRPPMVPVVVLIGGATAVTSSCVAIPCTTKAKFTSWSAPRPAGSQATIAGSLVALAVTVYVPTGSRGSE